MLCAVLDRQSGLPEIARLCFLIARATLRGYSCSWRARHLDRHPRESGVQAGLDSRFRGNDEEVVLAAIAEGTHDMAVTKKHHEFHAVDLSAGWETLPGYPKGIE